MNNNNLQGFYMCAIGEPWDAEVNLSSESQLGIETRDDIPVMH